jgi:hypothetical protein
MQVAGLSTCIPTAEPTRLAHIHQRAWFCFFETIRVADASCMNTVEIECENLELGTTNNIFLAGNRSWSLIVPSLVFVWLFRVESTGTICGIHMLIRTGWLAGFVYLGIKSNPILNRNSDLFFPHERSDQTYCLKSNPATLLLGYIYTGRLVLFIFR